METAHDTKDPTTPALDPAQPTDTQTSSPPTDIAAPLTSATQSPSPSPSPWTPQQGVDSGTATSALAPLSAPTAAGPSSERVTPTISLTPATPDTAHFITDKIPRPTPSPPAEDTPTHASADITMAANKLNGTAAAPTSTSPAAGPSTARAPANTQGSKATATRPKRKRTGFNKFLAAFGCLSAHDLEDDPATVKKREAATAKRKEQEKEKGSVGPTPPSTAGGTAVSTGTEPATVGAVANKDKEKEIAGDAGDAGTGGTTLSDAKDVDKSKVKDTAGEKVDGQVVVPPSEPTSPPLAETAGLTSGAVQPPGSGSELLHHTPSKSSMQRRESDGSITGVSSGSGPLVTGGAAAGAGAASSTAGSGVVSGTETLQHEESDRSGVSDDEDDDDGHEHDHDYEQGLEDEYEEEDRLINQGGLGIPVDEYGNPAPLLPAISKEHIGRKCLVLDLDETLLHSSFKMLPTADYIVPVEIESQVHNVYVIKRPEVDRFLTEMGKIYEIVVFTASLSKYADPVLDMLDPNGVVKHRLFRESCYNHKGNYVKDLSQLGRTMETSIIIDNSPASYIFHPNNAVPVSTWFNDPHDTELTDLCPFLADLSEVDDVRGVLDGSL